MELVEVENKDEVKLLRSLLSFYGMQPRVPGGGLGPGSRFFALREDRYWVAGCWVHDPAPFRNVAVQLGLPVSNAYFLRRVAQFAPGRWGCELLKLLARRLIEVEGKRNVWTLGLPDHSNALYREAGWVLVGYTSRRRFPVYAALTPQRGGGE